MTQRVAVFMDYQNVYRRAREAFGLTEDPASSGQIYPMRVAKLITERRNEPSELVAVRIYRGLPQSNRDSKAYGAARAQISKWERSDARLQVITRSLRYPYGWPDGCGAEKPEEKGIDVSLAIDFAAMAVRGQYDVGVIFSGDSDLKPALEFVSSYDVNAKAEAAAWLPPKRMKLHPQRLTLDRRSLWCHNLNEVDFEAVRDDQDFTAPSPRLPGF